MNKKFYLPSLLLLTFYALLAYFFSFQKEIYIGLAFITLFFMVEQFIMLNIFKSKEYFLYIYLLLSLVKNMALGTIAVLNSELTKENLLFFSSFYFLNLGLQLYFIYKHLTVENNS